MIKNNESFDNLINYFDSEQYKQLMKGFISVSETAESLLDKFSFNILDSMTSALINISKSFEQRQSKILFDCLEVLKNVPLDSLDWNSSSNREVQLDDQSVERVSNIIETAIPDEASEKQSLENFLKTHEHTIGFVLALISILLELYFGLFPPSNNQSESFEENNQTTVQYLEADLSLQKELLLSIQELTQLLKDQNYPIEDISSGVNEDKDPERQENNCNIDDDISDP